MHLQELALEIFGVGFKLSSFHTCSLFYLPSNEMLDSFCRIPKCLTTHLSYHRFFVNGVLRALIAKTKSNQSLGWVVTLLKVLHSCLMFGYRWEYHCLRLKTSTLKPCHIICQLGSGLDNVDGVKAMLLEPTFRLN